MRHGDKINNLGRKSAHRKALMANMACSLIEHKRIFTTVAKARALRTYVEPLLTKSKDDTTHSRRIVFSYLKSKDAVSTLFKEVATKIADRKGGYTRIIKTGTRPGDASDMAMIELVDFNEIYSNKEVAAGDKKAKTTRRSRAKKTTTTTAKAKKESGNEETKTEE